MIPEAIQHRLNEIADKHGRIIYDQIKATLSKRQFTNTGELAQSLQLQITRATDRDTPRILITYADQGYFIGYKNPQWTKLPPVDELMKWAETKTFFFFFGYKSSRNLTPFKPRERVVWAIAKNKKAQDTWKPKRWKRASKLGDLLADMNTEMIDAFTKEVLDAVADSLMGTTS